ncbi:MAG TPA: hypothetical protein DD716_04920 [Thiomicrospira sp.]|jgi:DnaJ like chaperone protein|nr:hypothetical protein [Thiomicrospira sp.]
MIKKILLFIPAILILLTVLSIKVIVWLIRRISDFSQNLFHSVKNSDGFADAYQNLASDKYTKSRLSMPEEIIALMAKIAASDGQVSKLEVEYMSDTIKTMVSGMQRAKVPASIVERTKTKLFSIANSAKKDDKTILFYTEALRKSRPEVRQGAFMQIIAFSLLDGISDQTMPMLKEIGQALKFSEQQIKALIKQVEGGALNGSGYDSNKNPYEELGCKEGDDFASVKKAYHRLVKANHPDYMQGQGKNEDEIKKTTEKMQEINAAFAEIKRLTGKK